MVLRNRICLLLLFAGPAAYAQLEPQFTQNMFNRQFYNPGFVGSDRVFSVTAFHREDFLDLKDHPAVNLVSIGSNFNLPALAMRNNGIGLTVFSDQTELITDRTARLNYSIPLSADLFGGELRLGIALEVLKSEITNDINTSHPLGLDPAIISSAATYWNAGAGIYYSSTKTYLGFSSQRIVSEHFTDKTKKDIWHQKLNRHYYAMAGYHHELKTIFPLQLEPSLLLKSSRNQSLLDINLNLLCYKLFWFGASIRANSDYISQIPLLAGIDFKKIQPLSGLRLGAAIDFSNSALSRSLGNSVEIMLFYSHQISKKQSNDIP
jgi:type IX secretion system PorP/SprF family membrane protein